MRVIILYSFGYKGLERKVNSFLAENERDIEVVEIKWKCFLEHYAMIVYKPK